MKNFSLLWSNDFFLLGGVNFFGSLLLLLLFPFLPMGLWEPLNAVWQFLFLLLFLSVLFGVVPGFFAVMKKKHPDAVVVCESFGWIPYVYVSAFTTLAGLDILGHFRLQFSPVGMWLTVIVPVVISLIVLYRRTRKLRTASALGSVTQKVAKAALLTVPSFAKKTLKSVQVSKKVAVEPEAAKRMVIARVGVAGKTAVQAKVVKHAFLATTKKPSVKNAGSVAVAKKVAVKKVVIKKVAVKSAKRK